MPPHGNNHGVTPAAYDNGDATVVLPDYAGYAYGRYVLGPAEMTRLDHQDGGGQPQFADRRVGSGHQLHREGLDPVQQVRRQLTTSATSQDESNPPYCALQAIELDATVESAPAIEAASFNGGATINGSTSDPFTSTQASEPGPGAQLRVPARALRGPGHQQRLAPDRHRLAQRRGHRRRRGRAPRAHLPDHLLPCPGPGGGDRHMHVRRLHLRHNHLAQRTRGPGPDACRG